MQASSGLGSTPVVCTVKATTLGFSVWALGGLRATLGFCIPSLADCLMVNGPCIWIKMMSHPNLVFGQVLVLVFGSKVSFSGFFLSDSGNIWMCVCECISSLAVFIQAQTWDLRF